MTLPPETGFGYEIHGPTDDRPVVEAWSKDYVRFGRLPEWQQSLREAIRTRCRELVPSADQVLHATFSGSKLSNADVENVVLYNIDTFSTAGRYGIRLGTFAGEKKLAQTWLALTSACARGEVSVANQSTGNAAFALRLQMRPPPGVQPVWGGLLKGIFDGVICAFQAHTGESSVGEVARRLADQLAADPDELAERLTDQRCAVLGAVPRLVSAYRSGVKWDPIDHMCVAGELLPAESVEKSWAVKGALVEVVRA
jgi:hypothetical protein